MIKGLFYNTYRKLAEEATHDGNAIYEWSSAREINFDEIVQVADEHVASMGPPGIALMIEPAALLMMGMHVGYEAAMMKVRKEQERDLGL